MKLRTEQSTDGGWWTLSVYADGRLIGQVEQRGKFSARAAEAEAVKVAREAACGCGELVALGHEVCAKCEAQAGAVAP